MQAVGAVDRDDAGRRERRVIVFDTAEQERVVSVDRIGEAEAGAEEE